MRRVLLLLASGLLVGSSAGAAVYTNTYDVSASGFSRTFGSAPLSSIPFTTLSGRFIVSFDDSLTVENQTSISATGLNVPLSSALGYSFDAAANRLTIGGLETDVDGISIGNTSDIYFEISSPNTAPTVSGLVFTLGNDTVFRASTATATLVTSGTVPEASTWMMMLAGFGGIGVVMRRRRPALCPA